MGPVVARPARLLVLDNFETVLEPGQGEGSYRAGYAGYGRLLQAVGEGRHQSCLVLTSREAPPELAVLGGSAVRTLQLGGLGVAEGQVLLADKRLTGSKAEWADLIARFGGNGLALKVVGERIREVFAGEIAAFLEEAAGGAVFGLIRQLLAEQLGRSSALGQDVLRVLAVEREPVPLVELLAALGPRRGRAAVLEAVEALRRRSLLEHAEATGAAAFTLQSVVLEHLTDRLVEEVSDEVARGDPVRLVAQPLIKAQSRDYMRHTQERLIGEPILQQLRARQDVAGVEPPLLALLGGWRERSRADQGYGPGNVVNLLRLGRGNLRGLDLERLELRQVYLAGVDARDASLVGAHLAEAVLAEAFSFPLSLALSGDGAFLVAGTSAGEVWLWRVADRTPLLTVQAHTGPVHGVGLSADGRLLASASEDGTVRLWAAHDGTLLATLQDDAVGGVWGVALSADGRLLASGGQDGTIRLWAVPSARPLGIVQGHAGGIRSLALSADGRLLGSGGEDGTVRVWTVPDGGRLAALQGHTGRARPDGTVRLWEVPDGRLLATLDEHTGGVRNVALSADGRLLASGNWDGAVRLWDAPSGRLLAALPGHSGRVWGVALSADGRLLASGSWDGTVRLCEAPGGRLLASVRSDRRCERMDITSLTGVTEAQRAALLALGALEQPGPDSRPTQAALSA